MRTLAAFGLLLAALAALPSPAADDPPKAAGPPAWPTPTAEQRPWTRWWWLGSAVDKPNITRSLEEFQRAGIGGVEICPIYGAKGAEDQYLDFLSPKWVEMLTHTTAEAKRLRLGVDLTTGTGWPFGGPGVTDADASARVVLKSYDLAGGKTLGEKLPPGKLHAVRAMSADGKQLDLTDKTKDGRLDWTAPAGTWKVYAVVQQSPVMKVKRAAPGGVGNVLDPFSIAKLDKYLAAFDKAFAGFKAPVPRGHFHDSYEYYNASWTDDLFAEFQKRRGYDLREQLPALFGDGPADTVSRVKCDYRETVSDLHREYVARWTDWCHRHGGRSRNQAHGGPGNILDAYAAADIPECEIYTHYADAHLPFLKMASSAAHLTGRNLSSAESFTWLGEHFQTPLSQVKPAADFLFLAGVNHVFFHGIPYSPADAPWPGWQFYASVNFGPGGGLWRDLPAFNAYVIRCQSVLQAGKPSNDVLLYVPFHDYWSSPQGLLTTFAMPGKWMESHPTHAAAMTLWEQGLGYDLVSDRLLDNAKVKGGQIILGGNAYRGVVIPKSRAMPPATMRKLVDLAKAGGKVVVEDSLPADVPGYGNLEKGRAELKELRETIEKAKEFDRPEDGFRRARVGIGYIYIGNNLSKMLGAFAELFMPTGEPMVIDGLRFIRRARPDDEYDYFVVNRGTKPVDGWICLAREVSSIVFMDPMTEKGIGRAAVVHAPDQCPEVYIQLLPGESMIMRTLRLRVSNATLWRYTQPAGDPVAVAGPWKVQFIDGGPALPAAFETRDLASWTARDDPEAKRFAGTARYTAEFDRPAAADDWILELGKVCESARVAVNGRPVGTLFSTPFRVSVGEFLKPGRNTLDVEVTNLATNRIADMDRRKVNWKYFHDANLANHPDAKLRGVLDASNWPLRDSGLIGPVRLVPVKWFDPGANR